MPTPILTACRQAVWAAIDAHTPLNNVFKRKYKFEDRPGGIPGAPDPSMGDIPAISIYPANPSSTWVLNQYQQIVYPLTVTIWTRDWQVLDAERYWEEIIKAMYQQLEPGTGNTNRVQGFTPIAGQAVQLGDNGPVATQWTFQMSILAAFWNPRLN